MFHRYNLVTNGVVFLLAGVMPHDAHSLARHERPAHCDSAATYCENLTSHLFAEVLPQIGSDFCVSLYLTEINPAAHISQCNICWKEPATYVNELYCNFMTIQPPPLIDSIGTRAYYAPDKNTVYCVDIPFLNDPETMITQEHVNTPSHDDHDILMTRLSRGDVIFDTLLQHQSLRSQVGNILSLFAFMSKPCKAPTNL